ncbi:MAG: DUF2079 domain-containing protein, partial [Candidatus Micrarchaeales archaeon]
MEIVKRNINVFAVLAIIFTLISMTYWSIYAIHNYNHFNNDAREYATSFYYDAAYPNVAHGFQFLVFGNHIAPDQVLLVPIYYIFQSPLTLLIIQGLFFSLTGLLVFFVARDFLKIEILALVLCIAFLISPSSQEVISSWYYLEYLIAPFSILAFYYYTKLNKKLFYISTVLLLGTIEIAPLITAALGIGLIIREKIYEKNTRLKKERIGLALNMLALAVVFLVLYNMIFYSLTSSYQAGYANLPPVLKVLPFPTVPLAKGFVESSNFTDGFLTTTNSSSIIAHAQKNLLAGIINPFLTFGIGAVFNPIVTLIFTGPWIIGYLFISTVGGNQFNAFFIAGSMIATITGMDIAIRKLRKVKQLRDRKIAIAFISSSTMSIVIFFYIFNSLLTYAAGPSQFNQQFLFQANATHDNVVNQLNSVLSLLPNNATVMADSLIYCHITSREYVEQPGYDYYFVPEYIIVDFNSSLLNYNDELQCLKNPLCLSNNSSPYNY